MRITDRMIVNHTLNHLNRGRERLGTAQEQVATGRRLLRPSDNPPDVERALTLSSELRAVENQVGNLASTRDWLSSTEAALDGYSDLSIELRNLALQAQNDTNGQDELDAISSQVSSLLEHALSVVNTRHGEYYLFSGQQSRTQPFERQGNAIVYNGDSETIQHMVELGQTMTVNVTGVEGANGGLLNGLNQILALEEALSTGDKAGIDAFLASTDDVRSDLAAAQSRLGSRVQRVDGALESLQTRELGIRQLYSQLVDADIAETVTEMNAEERAYEMTMAMSARSLPRSLLDYLR